MFQINGSSWYFVNVTGIRSLIPTGMACLMPDSFLLRTMRCRGGAALSARMGCARSSAPPPPRGPRTLCARGLRVLASRPNTSWRPLLRLRRPLRCDLRCFRIYAACFPSRAAVKPRRETSRKPLPPFRGRFCGGASSIGVLGIRKVAGRKLALSGSTRAAGSKPSPKRGYRFCEHLSAGTRRTPASVPMRA